MPAYDQVRYDPPAPLAYVTLRNPSTNAAETDVAMLIDSGADVTLVPQRAVQALGFDLNNESHYELMGFDGTTSFAQVVRLELNFEGRTFRGQFLITQDDVGILGRNVINTTALVLNGPHQEWYKLNAS